MTIKEIKEAYPEVYEIADKKTISWVLKNKKVLTEKFKSDYPKSPFDFVVQITSEKGSFLLNNLGELKRKSDVSHINTNQLKKLGCPVSI
jgi:hypothetical protein